jgi:hypothetical protein
MPLLDEARTIARAELIDGSDRAINQFLRLVVGGIFDHDGPDGDPELPVVVGLGRQEIELSSAFSRFRAEYRDVAIPLKEEMTEILVGLSSRMVERMFSDYEFLVDMLDFLIKPDFRRQREEASNFFRNHAHTEERYQRSAHPSLFAPIRAEWQMQAQDPEQAFEPLVFERFWANGEKAGLTRKDIDNIVFGATLMIGDSGDSDGVYSQPTVEDIRVAIGKFPLDRWPKNLREAYTNFFKSDVAYLLANISAKIRELFPMSNGNNVEHVSQVANHGSQKKKSFREVDKGMRSGDSKDTRANGEKVIEKFGLGIVKADPEGRFSHKIYPIEDDGIEDAIIRMSKHGVDPRMERDLVRIIKGLIDSPYQPGAKRLTKPAAYFSSEGHSRIPWRRFDPNGVRDFVFEHPESWRLRVLYAVVDGRVVIRRVVSHPEQDKMQAGDPTHI